MCLKMKTASQDKLGKVLKFNGQTSWVAGSSLLKMHGYVVTIYPFYTTVFPAIPITCIKPVLQATVEPLQSHETTDSVLLLLCK